MNPNSVDFYELLGVDMTASDEEIRRAYRTLSRTAHPDAGGTDALFRLVNDAYQTLTDPVARFDYDRARRAPVDDGPPAGGPRTTSGGDNTSAGSSGYGSGTGAHTDPPRRTAEADQLAAARRAAQQRRDAEMIRERELEEHAAIESSRRAWVAARVHATCLAAGAAAAAYLALASGFAEVVAGRAGTGLTAGLLDVVTPRPASAVVALVFAGAAAAGMWFSPISPQLASLHRAVRSAMIWAAAGTFAWAAWIPDVRALLAIALWSALGASIELVITTFPFGSLIPTRPAGLPGKLRRPSR